MNWIKSIAGRIWAVWALLFFVVTMIVFMIPFLLFSYFKEDPKKTYRFISFSRVWMAIYLTGIGCPLRVSGKKYFEPGKNYIVVCNHNSLMDIPISSPAIPGGNKTIAKVEMAKVPLFGLMYRTGSVLVDRKSDQSRKESYTRMKNVLAMGLHMCIYPEGTRNKSNEPLKSFHSGAFRLSIETGKAVIPAIIRNTRRVLPSDRTFYVEPHPLYMEFQPAVEPMPGETAEELKNRVFNIMKEAYIATRRN